MSAAIHLDLHTHLKIAKRTPMRGADVSLAAETLAQRGLDGLAITEHAHGFGFWDLYQRLLDERPYRHGRFEIGEKRFYPGLELTLDERVDILFIAPLAELHRLDEAFSTPLTAGYHPNAFELADRLGDLELDAIRIAAHPIRPDKHAGRIPEPLLGSLIHALEINGKLTSEECVTQVRAFADRLILPIVGGSDAHVWPQIGAASSIVHATSDRFSNVRDAVLAGRVEPVVRENAARMVRVAHRLKKRMKRRLPRLPKLPYLGPTSQATRS